MPQTLISRINGVDIVTVEREGLILVPIKPICQALGIDDKRQREKIQEDEILCSVGGLTPSTGADGKTYDMFCLPLMYIYGWLFTINPKNVSPEAREAVSRYRRECYDVLYRHFNESARRQQEQNRAEKSLLDEKAKCLQVIATSKECINSANGRIRKVDEQLAKLQAERLNPQPSLFS